MMKTEVREAFFHIEMLKRKKMQRTLLDIGLTPGQGQARILIFLSEHPGVSQKEIADACNLDVTTMSRTIDRMEKQGFLYRQRDPDCRRTCLVSLTAEGMRLAGVVKEKMQELEKLLCSGLDEEEISRLAGLLGKIRKNLEQAEEEEEKTKKNE